MQPIDSAACTCVDLPTDVRVSLSTKVPTALALNRSLTSVVSVFVTSLNYVYGRRRCSNLLIVNVVSFYFMLYVMYFKCLKR